MVSMALSPHEKGWVHMYQFTLTLHVQLVHFWVPADFLTMVAMLNCIHMKELVGQGLRTKQTVNFTLFQSSL